MTMLFVSDVDGTLVNRRAQLSDRTRAGLTALLEQGLPFTVASARSAYSLSVILAGLPLRLPVVEFNGAFLTELATGRRSFVRAIEPSLCDDIYERGRRLGLAPFVAAFDGKRDLLYASQPTNEGMRWYLDSRLAVHDPRLERVDDVRLGLRHAVVDMIFIAREQTLRPLFEALQAAYPTRLRLHLYENHYSHGWWWLEVQDFLATKANALAVLCEQLGMSRSNLTVFGDERNDIPMFEFASRAIAVGNAHEALKLLAHQVIEDHEQDSVVAYLERAFRPGAPAEQP